MKQQFLEEPLLLTAAVKCLSDEQSLLNVLRMLCIQIPTTSIKLSVLARCLINVADTNKWL